MVKELVSFEKIVLTDGIMVGGRKPATTIAKVAANRAYSIMSCPCSFLHSRVSISSARIELSSQGSYSSIMYQTRRDGNQEKTVVTSVNSLSQLVLWLLFCGPVRTLDNIPNLWDIG